MILIVMDHGVDLVSKRTEERRRRSGPTPRLEAEAFQDYVNTFGFVPKVAAAQAAVPRLIEVDRCVTAALASGNRLSPVQHELVQLAVATAHENIYETSLRFHALLQLGVDREQLERFLFDYRETNLPEVDVGLFDFALTLARHPTRIGPHDTERLRRLGFDDGCIVETSFVTAWSNYRCVTAAGLGVEPDIQPPWIPPASIRRTSFRAATESPTAASSPQGPFVSAPELDAESFPLFGLLKARDGAVPNVLLAQTLRPDLIIAQSAALERLLLTDGALSRLRKEYIFLAVSAANLSVYCSALHDAVLRSMGKTTGQSEQIAIDHHLADLSDADHALIDAALELAKRPGGPRRAAMARLADYGFSQMEILEAVAVTGAAYFTNTVSTALGPEPDFPPIPGLATPAHPFLSSPHQIPSERVSKNDFEDPDAASVAKVRQGDADAFGEIVRRHGRRIQLTLGGILRRPDEVDDAMQETFLKAYLNINQFQGRSLFATWLSRVAINVGLQRLRQRKDLESLDEDPWTIEKIQPQSLQPWQDNPERLYSRAETRDIILSALDTLPLKYRTAILLRDFQQFSTKEAALALGVGTAALKARLHRGRTMLRDALTPHFQHKAKSND